MPHTPIHRVFPIISSFWSMSWSFTLIFFAFIFFIFYYNNFQLFFTFTLLFFRHYYFLTVRNIWWWCLLDSVSWSFTFICFAFLFFIFYYNFFRTFLLPLLFCFFDTFLFLLYVTYDDGVSRSKNFQWLIHFLSQPKSIINSVP